MSAFEVGATHIDALLTAGLDREPNDGPLRWMSSRYTEQDRNDANAKGQPWGIRATELYRERIRQLTVDTAGQVGAMLVAENRRSVDYRYNETEIEEPYLFRPLRGNVKPLVVLQAISCFEYQACETPDWEDSEAHAFCVALRGAMIRALPGYGNHWEISDRDIFLTARSRA